MQGPPSLYVYARLLQWTADNNAADDLLASAVATFQGNINACATFGAICEPLLNCVIRRGAPKTLAALAARRDVNPYTFAERGEAALCFAMFVGSARLHAFLAAFPALDLNAPCHRDGTLPLAFLLDQEDYCVDKKTLELLLDAGAECSEHVWTAICESPSSKEYMAPHWTWARRRAWVTACVVGQANLSLASPLLAAVLGDALLRLCIVENDTHQLASEYAVMVAAFL